MFQFVPGPKGALLSLLEAQALTQNGARGYTLHAAGDNSVLLKSTEYPLELLWTSTGDVEVSFEGETESVGGLCGDFK